MSDAYLVKLIDWYYNQCNANWEQVFGIRISTMDNPGFTIKINLKDTKLENQSFKNISVDISDDDWFSCELENELFKGYSGIFNFPEVLQRFLDWSDEHEKITASQEKMQSNGILDWLLNWYDDQCNGDWEHGNGITIESLANPGWEIVINTENTDRDLENSPFQDIHLERTEIDWLFCKVEDNSFRANCGTYNLLEVLEIFKNWVEAS